MLIKQADDQSDGLRELELVAAGGGAEAKRAAETLRIRRAGHKGEAESAYLIDFDFGSSPNWAVIHDLRVEHGGRVAQIDHLLINRWMDLYVLETKHFHAGLKITEQGEFLRYDRYQRTFVGMASPLQPCRVQWNCTVAAAQTVQLHCTLRNSLPRKDSVSNPIARHRTPVAPQARIDRPKQFDSSRVIKADQLKPRIWQDIDDEGLLSILKTVAKMVSRDTVEFVARQLAAEHRPLLREPLAVKAEAAPPPAPVSVAPAPIEPTPATAPVASPPPSAAEAPACKTCSHGAGQILYGKFGYYFKCGRCDGNTAIRFTCLPGHKPRLRKDGVAFYRECADCGSSTLFHRNPA